MSDPAGDDPDPAKDRSANRARVVAYFAALNAGDFDAVVAQLTDDFLNEHTSALGSTSVGRDEYRRRLPGFVAQFDGLHYDVESLAVDGDAVVARYTLTAQFESHPIRIPGVLWFQLRDGRIAARTDFWDSLTFLRQTGAEP